MNSMNRHGAFEFVADPHAVAVAAGTRVVRVPIGISRKQSLFRCFDSALQFPGYFGRNWDAFRDLLLDLSWLEPPPREILIVHDDLPFVPGQRDLAIYLDVLQECASATGAPTFHVVFPESQRLAINQQVAG